MSLSLKIALQQLFGQTQQPLQTPHIQKTTSSASNQKLPSSTDLNFQIQAMPTLKALQDLTQFSLALQQNLQYFNRFKRLKACYDDVGTSKPVSLLIEIDQTINFFKAKSHWYGAKEQLEQLKKLQNLSVQHHKKRLLQSINSQLRQMTNQSRFLIKNNWRINHLSFEEFIRTAEYFGKRAGLDIFPQVIQNYYLQERMQFLKKIVQNKLKPGTTDRLKAYSQIQVLKDQEFNYLESLLGFSKDLLLAQTKKFKQAVNQVEVKNLHNLFVPQLFELHGFAKDKRITQCTAKLIKMNLRACSEHAKLICNYSAVLRENLGFLENPHGRNLAQELIKMALDEIQRVAQQYASKVDSYFWLINNYFQLINISNTLEMSLLGAKLRQLHQNAFEAFVKDMTFIICKPILQSKQMEMSFSQLQIKYSVFRQNYCKYSLHLWENSGKLQSLKLSLNELQKSCKEVLSQWQISLSERISEEQFQRLGLQQLAYFSRLS